MTPVECEFSRKLENIILGLIKDAPEVNVNEDYIIHDNNKRIKVELSIVEV